MAVKIWLPWSTMEDKKVEKAQKKPIQNSETEIIIEYYQNQQYHTDWRF